LSRHLRHGLISLAIALLVPALAVLAGRADAVGLASPALADGPESAADPIRVLIGPSVAEAVVCDEGLPPENFCRVPVQVIAPGPARLEASTYDRRAIAGEDYVPLLAVPLEVTEPAQYVEVRVELADDRVCEPEEDFLVVVTGPELQVITPVTIVDNDC
jgi:Calx-beta domain